MRVEVLEGHLSSMDSQQRRDMEARSSKCRAANIELSRIQVMTAISKHKK